MRRAKNKHKNKGKSVIIGALICIIILMAIVFIGFTLYAKSAANPVSEGDTQIIKVEIPMGSSTGAIADALYRNGVIQNTFVFTFESKQKGYAKDFKAGTYSLSKDMSMYEIMDSLKSGKSDSNIATFTIPEGFDIKRIAQRLEDAGLVSNEAFFYEVENGNFDYDFLKGIPKGENRLEGFLYPDTYEVYKDASAHDIINKMLARFNQLFTKEYKDQAKKMGFTVVEAVTLASIIEREAVVASDRPIISSAFHNRLDINMPLQSCATVQYILGEQKARLSIADTKIDSPYNTYIIKGLPPTPIASPRIESIQAALWPADTDYIYFLAKGDGSHVFTKTYDEFLKYKKQYIK